MAQQLTDWDAWEKGVARRLEKSDEANQELERRLLESERQLAEASRPRVPPAAAGSLDGATKSPDKDEQLAQRRLESERRVAELVRQKLRAQAESSKADLVITAPEKQEPQPGAGESERPSADTSRRKISSTLATPAADNRGKDTRRIARPCLVVIHRSINDEIQGWAVERSMEGLALLVDEKCVAGTPLRVRSGKSVNASWIDIVVEECCPERSSFKLRCSFASPVTWADIQHLAG
jgi:hypothetical protein